LGCYTKILITHEPQKNRTSIAFNENPLIRASTRFLAGAVCELSRQGKNGKNNCKARDNVEHIFGEHDPPPWRTLIRPNEH
jgi:hypothetical protein